LAAGERFNGLNVKSVGLGHPGELVIHSMQGHDGGTLRYSQVNPLLRGRNDGSRIWTTLSDHKPSVLRIRVLDPE
jgi:hypothetical protein